MVCYYPQDAYRTSGGGVTMVKNNSLTGQSNMKLPCGQCVGCRLEKSRQWAVRCHHEAQLHPQNSFITLTYSDDNLPPYGTLIKRDLQLFLKKLRKKYPQKIRFMGCGEYGSTYGRPHYHACLFNIDFDDKLLFKEENGIKLFTSAKLDKVWGLGMCTVGDVTFQSAAYVARYIMAKINGRDAHTHYQTFDPLTGEVIQLLPEFITMSTKPGIASGWYDKYQSDAYPDDFIIINNKKIRPPKFYDNKFELDSPDDFEKLKERRLLAAKRHPENNTKKRLRVRETLHNLKANRLIRNL